jgi:site-specific recombinase XerD
VKGDELANTIIADLETRLRQMVSERRSKGQSADLEVMKAELFEGQQLASALELRHLIDMWLASDKVRYSAGEITERTRWKNKRWTNDFWAFGVHLYSDKALLTDFKPNDIKEYVRWLRLNRDLSNNVAQATASHARTLMNYALDQEWIQRNPFINFRRRMDPVQRETLTEQEIKLFCTFPLESKALITVRDIFQFMCLTGLSFADVEKLTARSIRREGDRLYLHVHRQKMLSRSNTVPAIIPLFGEAVRILEKYTPEIDNQPLLPLQANAPFNRCLKQISAMCGLDKSVSTKVARNSLATYLLNQGVPLVSVSAVLGHSSVLTTQSSYAKTNPKRVIDDVSELNDRLNGGGLYGLSNSTITN